MGYQKILAVLVAVVLAVVATGAEGQATPSCAQKLAPCADYINSTNPPKSCCDPLRDAITNDLTCLCKLYNTPGLLASLNFNITQALLLPGRCKIPGDLNSCVKVSSAPSPTSSTAGSPTATPGKDNSGAGKIAWSGMSIILLFWTSIMVMIY